MEYPQYLTNLIQALKHYPSVGEKTATRMAIQMLEMDPALIDKFIEAFSSIKKDLSYCSICHNLCEGDICLICKDDSRDTTQICVVSHYKDIFSIEKMNRYFGVYHVLGGDIVLHKGKTPDKLNINSLLSRLQFNISEVIIATNPTIEGETTALYLSKVIDEYDVNITRIASGLPMGANIDYIDEMTMSKAFEGRNNFRSK